MPLRAQTARRRPRPISAGGNVTGTDWSAPMPNETAAKLKTGPGPQAMVDALLTATALPAAADTPAARPLTKIYLWQFDSTKTSPMASITDATPAVLTEYPPLAAAVVFHHWAPSDTWGLLGGCYRYRVVVTGSVPADRFDVRPGRQHALQHTAQPQLEPQATSSRLSRRSMGRSWRQLGDRSLPGDLGLARGRFRFPRQPR